MRNITSLIAALLMLCTVTSYAQGDWQLQIIGGVATPGQAQAVANSSIYAFIADGENGLSVYDISNPTFPTSVGGFNNGGIVSDIIIEDTCAYLAHWARGMTVINITNPNTPELITTFNTPGSVIDIYKVDSLMYLADFFNGLIILDISDLDNITEAGFASQIAAISVAAVDSAIYVGSQSLGLITYAIADTVQPVVRDFDEISTDCNDITVYNNYLLLACGQAGMLVYDITDRLNPDSVTAFNTAGSCNRIAVKDTIAYIADGDSGLVAVNISDPENPQLIQVMDTPSSTRGIGFADDFVLLADSWMLLVVYHESYSDIEEVPDALPSRLSLHGCYPNPFNPSTKISFELKEPSQIAIEIYDIQGRLIEKLVDGYYFAGNYSVKWNANGNPTGMYFIRLSGDGQAVSTKALYLK